MQKVKLSNNVNIVLIDWLIDKCVKTVSENRVR